MSGRINFSISEFYCCKCGNKGISLPRREGQNREAGHLKKLYCIKCQEEQNHVEIREHSGDYTLKDFQLEKKYNNFDENGQRIIPYRILRGQIKQKENNKASLG